MKNKPIQFIKMHGAGNDFVFLTPAMAGRAVTPALARLLLDRHVGIGGDQLLLLKKISGPAPYQLDFFNADGSQAEMCGNGTRAAAAYLKARGEVKKDFFIKTKRGLIGIRLGSHGLEVDMGEPILKNAFVRKLAVKGRRVQIHTVSMGNPHCVVFVPNVDQFPVAEVGPLLERHPLFPNRTNVEFVQVLSRRRARVRVWERGAGETLACGTGACAVGVVGARLGYFDRRVSLSLPGGVLRVFWRDDNRVILTGPTAVTYEGRFYV